MILLHKHIYAWFFFHTYFQISLFLCSISEIYFLLSLPWYGIGIFVQNFHWSRYEATDLSFSCLYSAFSIEKVYLSFLKKSLLKSYLKHRGFSCFPWLHVWTLQLYLYHISLCFFYWPSETHTIMPSCYCCLIFPMSWKHPFLRRLCSLYFFLFTSVL